MIIKIFTGPLNYDIKNIYNKDENEYIIGVDQGCKLLIDNNMKIDLALGDFDSIEKNSFDSIKEYAKKTVIFNKNKNYTDTFLAVSKALTLEHTEIIIYGGLGKRTDHTLANINLLKLGNINIVNNETIMYMLNPGVYEVSPSFKYISFFAIEDISKLNLVGFKFDVEDYDLIVDDPLCISNEGKGKVSFEEGLLLVIEQNE